MIGKRLREARIAAGLTQIDLAVATGDGYGSSMISQVESDVRRPRLEGAVNAARVLGVSLDYLVGLTDDPRPYGEVAAQRLKHGTLEDGLARESSFSYSDGAVAEGDFSEAGARYVEIH